MDAVKMPPDKSPEPTPVALLVPPSRLTVSAAWFSFDRQAETFLQARCLRFMPQLTSAYSGRLH
jgi:hypothetical protein